MCKFTVENVLAVGRAADNCAVADDKKVFATMTMLLLMMMMMIVVLVVGAEVM